MTRVFALPDLGEGLTEAQLVRWLVAEGDEVRTDQPVVEVETAKSLVEVPSPFAGVVARLCGEEGDIVPVGAPLIEVSEVSEPGDAYRDEERAGASGNVLIGYGTTGHGAASARRRPPLHATVAPSRTAAPVAVVSPIIRQLAREHGVDLATIPASGANGAVTRGDVLRAASLRAGVAIASDAGHQMAGLAIAKREPLGMLRRTAAAKFTRSRAEIPEATVWVDVDATELWELRRSMGGGEPAPSLTAFLARFAVLALAEYPALGGRLSDDGSELLEFAGVNLGIAVDTPRGLVVPVLRSAHELTVGALDREVHRIGDAARAGSLAPDELTGSTFTFNNYGAFGVDGSAAIINHPEVAILGAGRAIERPWVVDGAIVARRILQLSLVFDHRVCDGGYAAGFLRTVVDAIEHPTRLISRV